MKSLNSRIWCGDLEIVYATESPYVHLFQNLASLANDVLFLESIHEYWADEPNETINIKIEYTIDNTLHTIWTLRSSDFLNLELLFLLNKQLNLTEYKFEYSHKSESIYFITGAEKMELEKEGIVFNSTDTASYFRFILHNLLMNLRAGENDFTYTLVDELNQHAIAFSQRDAENREYKKIREFIRREVLANLNWEKAIEKGIATDKLFKLVN
jgi:hypothetical protein